MYTQETQARKRFGSPHAQTKISLQRRSQDFSNYVPLCSSHNHSKTQQLSTSMIFQKEKLLHSKLDFTE